MKYVSFLFLMVTACQSPKSNAILDIQNQMAAQEISWNSGNLENFMLPYWRSDSLIFIGKKGPTYGWQKTLDNYKTSYPDARSMGTLKFKNLDYKILNREYIWLIGQWNLYRTTDTLSGHYTLLWQQINGQWRIVADHSS